MHPNPAFRQTPEEQNLEFAAARGFGVLAVNGDAGPLLTHVPVLVKGDQVGFHLVRSNPILRELPSVGAFAVTGPHSYVSPDWYEVDDQVPTWNYVAVHLRGRIERLPDEALLGVLDGLSGKFEEQLQKPVWKREKMDEGALHRMLRMIVPCRMEIEDVQGTWKLNQNKDDDVRFRAADAIERDGIGESLSELAKLMRY